MARCKNCGKANRDGALFCQDCGRSVGSQASALVGGPASAVAGSVGQAAGAAIPMVSSEPEAVVPDRSPALALAHEDRLPALPQVAASDHAACESCGTMNPIAVSFCRSCGQNLNLKRQPQTKIACGHCGHPTPAGFMYCQHCGNRIIPETANRPVTPRRVSEPPKAPLPSPAPAVAPPRAASPEPSSARDKGGLRGRFVLLRRDGSDGEVISLSGETCDLGRATHRCLADDPYLAPRHARISVSAGSVRVRPLDQVNGVFLQLREPHELQAGDVFFVGRELIRFELLSSDERDLPAVSEQGVRVLGSIPRESWGRLRQLTTAAVSRDIWHLSRAEILLGREEGDVVFPDDEYMSRRHALVSRVGGKVRLEDQNSSNGTYVRLRGDRDILPGDILRLGEQVLRYEP